MKYLFLAFVLFGCKHIAHHYDTPKISTEILDTIKTSPVKITAAPLLLETAFVKGTTEIVNDKTLNLYGINIGKLKIESGYIVACDPGHIDEYGIPFTQLFPTGEFPVQLSIARLGLQETIAFARINFSDEPVERWEFALQKDQKPLVVGGEEMHGYSVDLGVGMFADEVASKAIDKSKLTDLDAPLYKEMDTHYHNTWRYAMHNFGKHNVAVFSSGFGDGYYATYVGFDAKGKPCRLVTDFGLFHWKK